MPSFIIAYFGKVYVPLRDLLQKVTNVSIYGRQLVYHYFKQPEYGRLLDYIFIYDKD